jgi:zinc protease
MKICFQNIVLISLFIIVSCAFKSVDSSSTLLNPDQLSYPALQFSPSKAQRVILGNGIILHILEDHELPLINISAVIMTGSVHDPIGKEGLAELTAEVMRTGGTFSMSGNAVDEALETIAGLMTISMNRDSGTINLSVLKKDMDEGLNILSQTLQHPAFEENKLELSKELKIEDLRRVADNPQKLAFREFNRVMYRNNPRGRLSSVSSVHNILRDDLMKFHKRFFYPQNIMISITGDITKNEAIDKINQYLGEWKTSVKQGDVIPAPEKQKGHIYFLPKETPQSIIIYGNLAPAQKDTDAYAFEVLDFIVGSGGFKSRIYQQVRSDLGLAYSVGSFYKGKSDYGIFGAYAMTSSESTSTVLSLMQSIIGDVRKNLVNKGELDWAKNSINNSFIFSFLSAHQIATQQMMNEYNQLPENYLISYRDNIAKVSADDVKVVADKYLSLNEATILVVGNIKAYNLLKSSFSDIYKLEALK